MRINLIVAMTAAGIIGRDGTLPWHLSADLKRFKSITMGYPIVMGRRTYVSIGKPLPGRQNIVVSRDSSFTATGCDVASSLDRAIEMAGDADELMIIGGASLYREGLQRASRIYLTEVHADIDGDTSFPIFERTAWQEVERVAHAADERNDYPFSFVVLDRNPSANDQSSIGKQTFEGTEKS